MSANLKRAAHALALPENGEVLAKIHLVALRGLRNSYNEAP
jgi:hypothetical protein